MKMLLPSEIKKQNKSTSKKRKPVDSINADKVIDQDAGFSSVIHGTINVLDQNNKNTKQLTKAEFANLYQKIVQLKDKESLTKILQAVAENKDFSPSLLTDIFPQYAKSKQSADAPLDWKPKELWLDRDKSLKETAVSFIKRVYAPVLDGYFSTGDLKHLDKSLYLAYYREEKPPLDVLNLPTKDQVNVRLKKEGFETYKDLVIYNYKDVERNLKNSKKISKHSSADIV